MTRTIAPDERSAYSKLRHFVALCIPVVVALTYFFSPPRSVGRPTYYSETAWSFPSKTLKAGEETSGIHESARESFHKRLEQYRERCDSLSSNIYYWVLLVGLTILVLAQQKKDPYEIFSIPIPAGAIRMLIVVSMLYLWIDFGSTLKFLIYERMALWKLVDAIEGPLPVDRSVGITSLRPLIHGKSFLDGWFATFLPEFSLRWVSTGSYRVVNDVLNKFIWGAGAAMIGLAHASAFAILENVGNLWRDNRLVKYGVPVGLMFIAGIILGCYLWFQLDGQGRWFFVACAVAAGAFIELLPYLPRFGAARAVST